MLVSLASGLFGDCSTNLSRVIGPELLAISGQCRFSHVAHPYNSRVPSSLLSLAKFRNTFTFFFTFL